jgi:hypothetical protein
MNLQAGNNKPHFPTNTIHAVRLCLFQATRRPQKIEQIIETSFGKIRVKGRLGQTHLDIFEAICYSRERKQDEDDRIKILVDPWEIKKKSNQLSGSTLEKMLDDLMQAIIEIIEPERLACTGHLIDHIDKAYRQDGSPIMRTGRFKERQLWTVHLGKAFCTLIKKDIWIGYDPTGIARLDHGISQAVARHVLSHKDMPIGGWRLKTLIHAAAGDVSDEMRWKYTERVKADAEKMAQIGIFLENGRVRTNQDKAPDTKATWPDA